jgi:hypothetical protein
MRRRSLQATGSLLRRSRAKSDTRRIDGSVEQFVSAVRCRRGSLGDLGGRRPAATEGVPNRRSRRTVAQAVSEQILGLSRLCWPRRMSNPFRYFNSSPEVIWLVVMMYVRYPLSLRNVEALFGRARDRHQPRDRPVLMGDPHPSVESMGRAVAQRDIRRRQSVMARTLRSSRVFGRAAPHRCRPKTQAGTASRTLWSFPCCERFPCVRAAATPRRSGWALLSKQSERANVTMPPRTVRRDWSASPIAA